MRSTRLQHWMSRLAWVAVLLLVTAPTLSRWLPQVEASGGEHMAMMMADDSGGMMAMHHHAMPGPDNQQPPMPMNGAHDGVCAYCPLLASLLPTLLVLAILLPLLQRIRLREASVIASRVLPLRLGLGARGPPIQL